MPYTLLSDTHAKVSDFLSHHPSNFHFSTSIRDDALILSFYLTHSFPPTNPSPLFTVSEPPSPPYSPLQWDSDRPSLVQEENIVSPAPETIPLRANSIFNSAETGTINDGTLSMVKEEGETLKKKFDETLDATFSENHADSIFNKSLLNINILAQAGYSINIDSTTTTSMQERPSIEPGNAQVLSSPLMDSSNLSNTTANFVTPSQVSSPAQDHVDVDDSSDNVFFSRLTINTDGPPVPVPPNIDYTPPIPPTPPVSHITPETDITMPPLEYIDSVFSFCTLYFSAPFAAVLDSISPHEADEYLHTKIVQLNNFHSIYLDHVVNAIASYLFGQDQLISMTGQLNSIMMILIQDISLSLGILSWRSMFDSRLA
ncbi:hypothetical protein BDR07DRAFT_1489805 [Suillus spraguei]|nr:hypothetical protein BDR07DRAFT_1489805 [Suillus spraguei]